MGFAMAEFAHRLGRVGGPGSYAVRLLYDVSGVNHELPFVVGVLANLSGYRPNRRPLRERSFVTIDRDDFDERLERIAPELRFDSPAFGAVALKFTALDDFEPGRVAAQVPAVGELLRARQRLSDFLNRMESRERLEALLTDLMRQSEQVRAVARDLNVAPTEAAPTALPATGGSLLDQIIGGMDPAGPPLPPAVPDRDLVDSVIREALKSARTMSPDVKATAQCWITALDQRLANGVRSLLHHAEFTKIEATWRGLYYLVRRAETGTMLKLKVLDLSRDELASDLSAGVPGSELCERVCRHAPNNDEPFGLLVGDFEFGPTAGDVVLLAELGRLAMRAHAPFVATASPALVGLDNFAELPEVEDLLDRAKVASLDDWRQIRTTPEANYVALTVPRTLARRPYGKEHTEVAEFTFEELTGDAPPRHGVWMSAVWAYATTVAGTFALHIWLLRSTDDGDGVIDDLPSFPIRIDGETVMVGPVEANLSDRRESQLASLGLLPLSGYRNDSRMAFLSSSSCREGVSAIRFDDLLCACRVAHYLRALWPATGTVAEKVALLNAWLGRYVDASPRARHPYDGGLPLADGRVSADASGGLTLTLRLRIAETAGNVITMPVMAGD
jgi:type VI secretion system protein ImpC